ncbi:MAG: nucleotidyltransferase domain-containing protein [Candidatus Woesearchaeota archaeon]|nr:nucleotidyltransferase domain-containing protein [Candidatus Woesearchaeota archaeon]
MDTYKLKITKLNFTRLEQAIFSLLCVRAGELLSQRDIAKVLRVSPTAVSKPLKKLKKYSLIKIKKTKTINFISLNREEQWVMQLKRAENLKNIYLSRVLPYLEEELPGGTIVLFGSYSRGDDTTTSDLDLAVIGRKDKLLHLEPYEKIFARQININFYDSWKDIGIHLKNNLLNGIVLTGSVDL